MKHGTKLGLVREMPELEEGEAVSWLVGKSEVRGWLLERLKLMSLIEEGGGGKWKGSLLRTGGKGGRPSLIKNERLVETVLMVMGEREWGSRELMRACEYFICGATLRRLLLEQVRLGVVKWDGGGRWLPGQKVNESKIRVIRRSGTAAAATPVV